VKQTKNAYDIYKYWITITNVICTSMTSDITLDCFNNHQWLIDWLIDWYQWLIDWLIDINDWLIDWLISMIDWLISMIDWLIIAKHPTAVFQLYSRQNKFNNI
jgi:hypothetical protein